MIHDNTAGDPFRVGFELLGLPFHLAMPICHVDQRIHGKR